MQWVIIEKKACDDLMKMGIPIGVQDYRKLRGEHYFTVDKTLLIEEFLERRSEVTSIEEELEVDEYKIRIPNKEVAKEFKSLTAYYLKYLM